MADTAFQLHAAQDLRPESLGVEVLNNRAVTSFVTAMKQGVMKEITLADLVNVTKINYEKLRPFFPQGKTPRIFIHPRLPQTQPAYAAYGDFPEIGPAVIVTEAGRLWRLENTQFSSREEIERDSKPFPTDTEARRKFLQTIRQLAACAGVSDLVILEGPPEVVGVPYIVAQTTISRDGTNFISVDPEALRNPNNLGTIAHELGHLSRRHQIGQKAIDAHNDPAVARQHETEADAFAVALGYGRELKASLAGDIREGVVAFKGDRKAFFYFQENFDLTHPRLDVRIDKIDEQIAKQGSSGASCKVRLNQANRPQR